MELRWLILYSLLIFTMEMCFGDEGEEVEDLVVILTECDYVTAEGYCSGMGGELAERESVLTNLDCIRRTIGSRRNRKYWVNQDNDCSGMKTDACAVEIKQTKMKPNFRYEKNAQNKDYYSLCEIDMSTHWSNQNISTTLCSPAPKTSRTTSEVTSEVTSERILTTPRSYHQSTKESITTIDPMMTTTLMNDFVTQVTEGRNNYLSTINSNRIEEQLEKLPDDSKGEIVAAVIGVICFLLFAIGTTLFIAAVKRVNQKRKSDQNMTFRSLNNMRPDQSVPSSATDSNKYFILEESAYSEVKENETDNLTNNNNQSTDETYSKANSREGMYDHLQRNESESRNDVKGGMYSHIHNKASDETLNNAKDDIAQGNNMYDHLEGKTGSDNNEIGTSIQKSVDLNPEYDHKAFFKDSSESQYDHTDLEANKETSSTENEDYDHMTLIN